MPVPVMMLRDLGKATFLSSNTLTIFSDWPPLPQSDLCPALFQKHNNLHCIFTKWQFYTNHSFIWNYN